MRTRADHLAGFLDALNLPTLVIVLPTTILGFVASGSRDVKRLLLGVTASALADVAANVLNNYADWEIDQRNGKRQALHEAIHRPTLLLLHGAILVVLARILVAGSNAPFIFSVIAFVAMGWLYSALLSLKDIVLVNCAAIGLSYGGLSYSIGLFADFSTPDVFKREWPFAAFLSLLFFGLSISKDYEDRRGDAVLGKRTLPVVVGHSKAVWIQASIIASAYLALIALLALGLLRPAFAALMLTLPVPLMLIARTAKARDRAEFEHLHRLSERHALLVLAVTGIVLWRW
jgi:geranylgeranylglycerol-phosphate geranylgeranyltransferase